MDIPLSNTDLTEHLQDVDGFVGVCSYDLLPRLKDAEFCVVNTDNVLHIYDPPEGGHHWLTVCREGNRLLVFDSFGRTLRQMEIDYTEPRLESYFHLAYPECELYSNTQVLQDMSTAVCGHYAILVGKLFASLGIDETLATLRRTFTDDKLDNDMRVVGGWRGVGMGRTPQKKDDDADWNERLADELHRQRRVHFPRRRVEVHGVDKIWSADLVDMQAFAKYNSGFRFMLTVIDLFSRYAWALPLKDKTGAAVRDAFQHILRTSGRKPEKLWVDEGKEFYNRTMKRWLAENAIEMYSTRNEGKAVVIERFNRTIKSRMWRHFTAGSTNVYVDVLPKLLDNYNHTKHRSIGMTPERASKQENERFVPTPKAKPATRPHRFQVGDEVRITVSKRHFEKGYTPNWTEEVFVIAQVLPTSPVTYRIQDLMDEPILGSFYEQQLQHARQTKFRIEKVLRKRQGQSLVKWMGYPEKFNSWISSEHVERLH